MQGLGFRGLAFRDLGDYESNKLPSTASKASLCVIDSRDSFHRH